MLLRFALSFATLLLIGSTGIALAAQPAAPTPPDMIPLPDEDDGAVPLIAPQGPNDPDISIRTEGDNTIEEYRRDGQVYMIKVTPRLGPPYYLIDASGQGRFMRHDGPLPPTAPAQWRILEF